ncbi:MAG: diphthine--ammonia ligase [Candidatus Woesearchaeota archaeon]
MCGIIGIFNMKNAPEMAILGLKIMKERGRDGFGIGCKDKIIHKKCLEEMEDVKRWEEDMAVAHCLHAMVGYVSQPIKGEGLLVVNCEIYNWPELSNIYNIKCRNDAELLLKIIEKVPDIRKVLSELDGSYSFCYWKGEKVVLARDIIGIKPLWYSIEKGLAFASEKKSLIALGYKKVIELNPREMLFYNTKTMETEFVQRTFFEIEPIIKRTKEQIVDDIYFLLRNAIAKRISKNRLGVLFSGGIDSSVIALITKQLGADFTCYTAVMDDAQTIAEDLLFAQKVSEVYGFKLRIKKIPLEQVEGLIKKVIPLIEDSNVTKVGVALTLYAACELAKNDGIRVVFSGLGSEEIFAGYERHKLAKDINKECLSGLMKIYERDTYRDDVVTMHNNIELRLPFLDIALVEYALKIPPQLKISEGENKVVLRELAKKIGLKEEFAKRKKRAAQYGSRFDNAIGRLARRERKLKSEFLKKYYTPPNLKLGVLFSSGKDSAYAMHLMQKQNYEIACLITIKSKNPASYMFHTPNVDIAKLQAEAMGIPLLEFETAGRKESELFDLERAIESAKKQYHIEGIVTGALFSEYQRKRIEKVCDKLGLKIFSPLWHMDQELELRQIVRSGFEVILVSIAAFGLDQKWLGKRMDHNLINNLKTIYNMYKINIAGEGGEYESLVLDGPMFKKKILIEDFEIIVEDNNTARLQINKVRLVEKGG